MILFFMFLFMFLFFIIYFCFFLYILFYFYFWGRGGLLLFVDVFHIFCNIVLGIIPTQQGAKSVWIWVRPDLFVGLNLDLNCL